MSLTLGDIQLNTSIKVKPISIVDTLDQEDINRSNNRSFLSRLREYFCRPSDLSFEAWEKLESKKRFLSHLDNFDIPYRNNHGGGYL